MTKQQKQQLNENISFILLKEVFYRHVTDKIGAPVLTLKDASDLFHRYWDYASENGELASPPVFDNTLKAAQEYYQANIFKKEANRKYLESLLFEKHDLKEQRFIRKTNEL